MRVGDNRLEADSKRHGVPEADLKVVNYPVSGPIISGPHESPYACTAQDFVPFPGSAPLGPTDGELPRAGRVQYIYRTNSNTFAPLPMPHTTLPANLA